jgi:hypothetical protein
MDNSQNNGASATLAEEQVQRAEGAAVGGNPVEGNPSADNMAPQAQTQTASVVDPDPESDPVGSGTFCRIRIRIRNKSFRVLIRLDT